MAYCKTTEGIKFNWNELLSYVKPSNEIYVSEFRLIDSGFLPIDCQFLAFDSGFLDNGFGYPPLN